MDELDLSDEALVGEAESESAEAVEETVEASPNEASESGSTETENGEGAPAEELASEEESKVWGGKYESPEALEKGFTSYRSWADRQLREQKEELEALREAFLEDADDAPETEGPAPVTPSEAAQLRELAATDPQSAFQWTLQNAPQNAPDIIGIVREEHGDILADRMHAQMNSMMLAAERERIKAEIQGDLKPILDERESAKQEAQFAQFASSFQNSVNQDHFEVLKDEFAEALNEWAPVLDKNVELAPQALKAAWAQAQLVGADKIRAAQSAQDNASTREKIASSAEVGIPGQAPAPVEKSETDTILDEMFQSGGQDYAY